MRVIAGTAKKRRLKSPGKLPVRPTADRVKEALFNILSTKIPGCKFADLYAGTGGIGIEALSRGAAEVLFVEKDPRAVRLLKENLKLTGLSAGAQIMPCDVDTALHRAAKNCEKFDIIFADPPYRQGLAVWTLNTLNGYSIRQENTLIVIETASDEKLPEFTGDFILWRREKYGDTTLYFYKTGMKGD